MTRPKEVTCGPSRSSDNRPFHKAKLIGQNGEISPLCYSKPRALPARARWTTTPSLVTCPKCLKKMAEVEP